VDGFLPVLVGGIVRAGWGSCGVGDVYVKWASRNVRTGKLLLLVAVVSGAYVSVCGVLESSQSWLNFACVHYNRCI
jgi:hypothetical protein